MQDIFDKIKYSHCFSPFLLDNYILLYIVVYVNSFRRKKLSFFNKKRP
nr:MAG TPA: hypothetical protein [Caudoviricetes sp.]